jgi:hypothetical protein
VVQSASASAHFEISLQSTLVFKICSIIDILKRDYLSA